MKLKTGIVSREGVASQWDLPAHVQRVWRFLVGRPKKAPCASMVSTEEEAEEEEEAGKSEKQIASIKKGGVEKQEHERWRESGVY
jgi:hypothetical protein